MTARRRTRAREAQLGFEALSIEGGLLSPEWLSKIAQLAGGGQADADYEVPKGLNLRDEIGRYWRMAQAHWRDFEAGRNAKAEPQGLAERFTQALLKDSLGFKSLLRSQAVVIAERSYPIGHAALAGRVPVVVAPAGSGLDTLSPAFGEGGRRRSAFGLAQEYLNAQDGALWGIATDGVKLRIVRDNASLTRPAWIEADLQRIFTEDRYADFAVLWLLCHETRFGREDTAATDSALESWREAGREEGTRAREHLRRGVEDALLALGQGFLSHSENHGLRASLHEGSLTTKDYFNQLLRLVYRLIFLLTVEERGLLHPTGTSEVAKSLYAHGYSLRRLRERSVKRSAHDRFGDLWEATKIVLRGLAGAEPRLGLPALAGIFARTQCPALDAARLENRALLLATFKLAWLRDDGALARVNWRDMGPEELGSVYESLLELVPQVTGGGRTFEFASGVETKGHARKTTGSYYTPDSLVQVLLDSALEPVIADTIARNPDDPVDALLGLSVVDPACGSGHFLLAAARRLAAHVARLVANGTPSASEYRHALRQVVSRCIHGVDLNPMAVELCKVSLWMEAVEPGLPLTFLDSHVQHGNALLGTTPDLMEKGIPDSAWEPIEGDDRNVASALKKRNKSEAATGVAQMVMEVSSSPTEAEVQAVSRAAAALEAAPDTDAQALARKESQWDGLLHSKEYQHQKLVADAWCAAFVWPKQHGALAGAAPTNELWRQIRDASGSWPALTTQTVNELSQQYRFFHWPLQFPTVFEKGGFDVVLGNPPWERVKLQEQEFFAARNDQIANAASAERKKLIAALADEDPSAWAAWRKAVREAAGAKHFLRESQVFPLTGLGDVNTYALFAERGRALLSRRGRFGVVLPTGIATDDSTKAFFSTVVRNAELSSFFSFENEGRVFPSVHHAFKFALMTLDCSRASHSADFVFFARNVHDLLAPERHFELSAEDFLLLSPHTLTAPTFRSRRDADLTKAIHRQTQPLRPRDGATAWNIVLRRMMHMSDDAPLFRTRVALESEGFRAEGNGFVRDGERVVPLYEAKLVHHFDHRFATYEGQTEAQSNQGKCPELSDSDHADAGRVIIPRYWVSAAEVASRLGAEWERDWVLGWRDICRSVDQRTLIPSLIPRAAFAGFHQIRVYAHPAECAAIYACLCSYVVDYAARQKVGGTHLTYGILEQIPLMEPAVVQGRVNWGQESLRDFLRPRVLELTYTAWDLEPFARDVGYDGPPFRWDPERRFLLRCELDAAFFHLYGLSRDDVDYVMDTFPIVRKNDEKAYGEYRTKRTILETYDEMAEAIRSGEPYQTRLNPPPADLAIAHPPRVVEVPAMPSFAPALPAEKEAALIVWALLQAAGGSMPRRTLARAFVLRGSPELLARLSPSSIAARSKAWAQKVAGRTLAPGLLAAVVGDLEDKAGLVFDTDGGGRSMVRVGSGTPVETKLDPWFRFEARMTLAVLESLREPSLQEIDGTLQGEDLAMVNGAS